jgi:hypothetical protein
MTTAETSLATPEALMRRFADRLNAGDLDGLDELDEPSVSSSHSPAWSSTATPPSATRSATARDRPDNPRRDHRSPGRRRRRARRKRLDDDRYRTRRLRHAPGRAERRGRPTTARWPTARRGGQAVTTDGLDDLVARTQRERQRETA